MGGQKKTRERTNATPHRPAPSPFPRLTRRSAETKGPRPPVASAAPRATATAAAAAGSADAIRAARRHSRSFAAATSAGAAARAAARAALSSPDSVDSASAASASASGSVFPAMRRAASHVAGRGGGLARKGSAADDDEPAAPVIASRRGRRGQAGGGRALWRGRVAQVTHALCVSVGVPALRRWHNGGPARTQGPETPRKTPHRERTSYGSPQCVTAGLPRSPRRMRQLLLSFPHPRPLLSHHHFFFSQRLHSGAVPAPHGQ